jgi:UDP-N-acetylmuramoylalanine--D-glutamate ligase
VGGTLEREVAVLNRADAAAMALAPAGARVNSFGPDAPVRSGEFGLVPDRGIDWLALAEGPNEPAPRRRAPHPDDAAVFIRRLMPSDALRIHGRHNAFNAMAALALARAIGCPLGPCLQALRAYRGESHRTELVAVKAGVEYYDDSKGTNVGATLAAIEGLATEGRKLVVILGGDGKQQRFAPLAAAVAAHARAAILIGRDGPLIGQALQAIPVPIESAATLPEAVRRAGALALAGDAVLLSPACASFDMFRNYAHRAEVFIQAVQELDDRPASAAAGAGVGDDPAADAGQAGARSAARAYCA